MIEARRKDNESIGAFLRRFTKKVQQSGVLMRARRIRFKVDAKNKKEKQLAAMRRVRTKQEREKLFKLGKLDEYGR
ncbi:hypothetical protein A3C91_01105 [Candidatus Azambacteria bacterium RIFCSPHIGHO2_02_FULL_52_12]|uniref:30S ribosomal protein S21 n=1 Tax=Candidatus Azambacteria bacterium RIFCSPLOWO2_01_FULL_46_25 TaxID=1797298 RepID=A0A1F5BU98_9BACT|nr:MAG: hypothetical protein A3C91_01105 [Candidatus Azambacteria bacterium RIFCSPHIGHO2_02_FULL_52_12]OGD34169.1 MAG: hypothetical protein A2988_01680 [Candidatus Azambacteria bacterium RIFCSPLOWO2_01_FULL_46_25]OGD37744.1 MAG: hypothetical protein A2850_03360 [Candidatus Azambacteria bacterium RIFCSPHIGHO2_01_FULL_51_74]